MMVMVMLMLMLMLVIVLVMVMLLVMMAMMVMMAMLMSDDSDDDTENGEDDTSVTYEMTDSDHSSSTSMRMMLDGEEEAEAEEEDSDKFELWKVDREEQQRAMEFYENKKRESTFLNRSTTAARRTRGGRINSGNSSNSRRKLSILPIPETLELYEGCSVPYKGSKATWEAIDTGLFNIVQCIVCRQDLCCVTEATGVMCSNCNSITPVVDEADGGDVIGFGVLSSDVKDHFQNNQAN